LKCLNSGEKELNSGGKELNSGEKEEIEKITYSYISVIKVESFKLID